MALLMLAITHRGFVFPPRVQRTLVTSPLTLAASLHRWFSCPMALRQRARRAPWMEPTQAVLEKTCWAKASTGEPAFKDWINLKAYRMDWMQMIAGYCRSLRAVFQQVALWIELGLHWNLQWMLSKGYVCLRCTQPVVWVRALMAESAEHQFELQPDVLKGGDPWKPSSLVGAKCSSACITSIFIHSWINYYFCRWNNLRNWHVMRRLRLDTIVGCRQSAFEFWAQLQTVFQATCWLDNAQTHSLNTRGKTKN